MCEWQLDQFEQYTGLDLIVMCQRDDIILCYQSTM